MKRVPTIKQLRYLATLAETRHFRQAADACYVTQSTLSAGINELEQILGIALVERDKRNVMLTPMGEQVVSSAHRILSELDDLVILCEAAGEPFSHPMRLGVIPTIAPYVLPDLLKRLRRQHAGFRLYIREQLSAELVKALHRGELDVLLLALPYDADRVQSLPLFNDPFYLACPRDHALAKVRNLRSSDLAGQDVLLLEEGHCLRDHVLEACKLKGSELNQPYQATSLNTVVQMVANGIGVTLLPDMAVRSKITIGTGIKTRAFKGARIGRSIGLMWRQKSPRVREFEILGDFIKDWASLNS